MARRPAPLNRTKVRKGPLAAAQRADARYKRDGHWLDKKDAKDLRNLANLARSASVAALVSRVNRLDTDVREEIPDGTWNELERAYRAHIPNSR